MKTRIFTTVMIALLGFMSFSIDAKPIHKSTKTGKTVVDKHKRGKGKAVVVKKNKRGKTVVVKRVHRGRAVMVKHNQRGHRHAAKHTKRHRHTCRR